MSNLSNSTTLPIQFSGAAPPVAIYSLLKHASCPESLFFHFLAAEGGGAPPVVDLRAAVAASFPSLRFKIYLFRADAVAGLISAAGGRGRGGGGRAEEEEEPGAAEDGGAGGFIGFSFQELEARPCVDEAEVLDAFAGSEEARKDKAKAEFLEATMGANTGPRTEAIKTELVVDERVLDLAGLERWMRREEAVSELEWLTGLCCEVD